MSKTQNEIMKIQSEIHLLEYHITIWKETSIPKFKQSIEYFMKELVHGEKTVTLLECNVAALKKELENEEMIK